MITAPAGLTLRLARDAQDLAAAQRLRYQVFVQELGATGALVDHQARLERDAYDEVFEHLLLIDETRPERGLDPVVGVYRLLTSDRMALTGRYYSEDEFDLAPLKATGRKLVELGRSCVHPDYRGGAAMLLLWNGLADFVLERGIEVMFGAASFHGTDPAPLAPALSYCIIIIWRPKLCACGPKGRTGRTWPCWPPKPCTAPRRWLWFRR